MQPACDLNRDYTAGDKTHPKSGLSRSRLCLFSRVGALGNGYIVLTEGAILILKYHEPHEKRIPVMIQFMGYAALKHLSLGRQVLPFVLKKEHNVSGDKKSIEARSPNNPDGVKNGLF